MKPYLLISLSDFPKSLLGKSPEERFRSLEKYLEKNAIPFESQGEVMYIYAKDEFEARTIGVDFRLKSLEYFNNGVWKELNFAKSKPIRQPRLKKSKKQDHDVFVNLKELRQIVRTEKTEAKTLVKTLKSKRILTDKELKQGIKDGLFHPVVVGGKKYLPDDEIKNFLSA